jgi:hypothetical protein
MNTFNLEYLSPSDDPIFPATTPSPCTTSNRTCWKDPVQPARVFGCTESAKVCAPSKDNCYDVWDPSTSQKLSSATWPGAAEALLVWFALSHSDFGRQSTASCSRQHAELLATNAPKPWILINGSLKCDDCLKCLCCAPSLRCCTWSGELQPIRLDIRTYCHHNLEMSATSSHSRSRSLGI